MMNKVYTVVEQIPMEGLVVALLVLNVIAAIFI